MELGKAKVVEGKEIYHYRLLKRLSAKMTVISYILMETH